MKVLVTPRSFAKLDRTPLDMLEAEGYEISSNTLQRPMTEEEMVEALVGMDGAIVGIDRLGRKAILSARSLKVISKYGVGIDNIDVEAATERGILVTITPGANTTAVADLTVGLMLATARKIPFADDLVRRGAWSRVVGVELSGKTIGLLGFGRIGREVARRVDGFSTRILAFEQTPGASAEFARRLSVEFTELSSLLAESDFVSVHVPLTPETRHLIGEQELRQMKKSAFLINTSRGGIVDESSLMKALKEGWIAGAALDVYEEEPPTDDELKLLPNVVLSPHMGAHTVEAASNMGRQAARNLVDALHGNLDPGVVINREVVDRQKDWRGVR